MSFMLVTKSLIFLRTYCPSHPSLELERDQFSHRRPAHVNSPSATSRQKKITPVVVIFCSSSAVALCAVENSEQKKILWITDICRNDRDLKAARVVTIVACPSDQKSRSGRCELNDCCSKLRALVFVTLPSRDCSPSDCGYLKDEWVIMKGSFHTSIWWSNISQSRWMCNPDTAPCWCCAWPMCIWVL